jgi:methyl-accepting chemotaxis protein
MAGRGDQLLLGSTAVNGRNDIVDAVKRVAGGVATLSRGDTGEIYQGRNETLGVTHVTIYEPIRDAAGRQIGILFVGVPAPDIQAQIRQLWLELSAMSLAFGVLIAIGG